MKKQISISIVTLLFFFNFTKGQNTPAAFSFDAMSVFYIGVDNPITVTSIHPIDSLSAVDGVCNIQIIEKSPSSKSVKCNVTCSAHTPRGQCVINVWSKGKSIETQEFRVKRIPDPELLLLEFKNGAEIDLSKLKTINENNECIFARHPSGFDFESDLKVVSWDITLIAGKKVLSFRGSGSNLSKEAKDALSKSSSGNKIFIEAKVKAADGTIRLCNVSFSIR